MSGTMLTVTTLWKREMVRFYRDRSRVIGGLVPPVIFWFFIGSGFSGSFRVGEGEGISYLLYFFPGILTLIFLFTAIFSTISIIEDRKEGFLQSVLVAPVPRTSIVLGKVLGSASLAFLQGIPFLILGYFGGIRIHHGMVLQTMIILFAISFVFASIGFLLAWILESAQGFHAIMNMFLIPMWLLSGSLFPIGNLPGWLAWLVKANPLTYAVAALQRVLFDPGVISSLPTMRQCAIVIFVYCAVCFAGALYVAKKRVNY